MLNTARIESDIFGLVGYRQPIETEFAILDVTNTETRSGKYFNGYSNLVRIENLKNSVTEFSDANFNTWLTQRTQEALINSCQDAIKGQRDLLEHRTLYHYENDFNTKITNIANRFVGYEIELRKKEGIALQFNTLMSQFDGVVAGLTIYLYHSSQKTAIKTFALTTQTDSVKTDSLSEFIIYYQNEVYIGGKFYIGYYQDDLGTVQAYDRRFERADIQNTFNNVLINEISVDDTTGITLFDVNNVNDNEQSWGLNFDISLYKDYTQYLIDNQVVIQDLIGLQTVAQLLNTMEFNNRNNDIQKTNQDTRILIELKGLDGAKELGIETRLEKEKERVQDLLFPDPRITRRTLN